MSVVSSVLEPFRRLSLEGGLKPPYPPVAVEVNPQDLVLVRVKRRRGRSTLEAVQVQPLPQPAHGLSMARPSLEAQEEVQSRLRGMFEAIEARPGKVSLVLPDNLAKVSLIPLPERPSSRKQLGEIIRFKLRKTVPFRIEDSAISYQLLSGEADDPCAVVAVMPRSVIEQYERLLEGIGARPGRVGLCTPNLFNLCREEMTRGAAAGEDVALLNCAQGYFSMLILRGARLIFYRCKSYAPGEEQAGVPNGMIQRELASSLSYYQEKLDGRTLGTVHVRSVSKPVEEIVTILEGMGIGKIRELDPSSYVTIPEGVTLDPAIAQKIVPAAAAAVGGGA